MITLAADGKEVSTEMVRFIKEALFIKTGDGANVVVKHAVDRLHRDGYIQLLSPPSGSKRKRVKQLSNQTRYIVDRRATAQADLYAPVDSPYIV